MKSDCFIATQSGWIVREVYSQQGSRKGHVSFHFSGLKVSSVGKSRQVMFFHDVLQHIAFCLMTVGLK